jgi:hypothetical protein
MRMRRDRLLVTVVVLTLYGTVSSFGQRGVPAVPSLPTAVPRPPVACGAPAHLPLFRGARALSPLSDNTLLAYEQFPRILTPTETGTIRIVAEVVGEVSEVSFRRSMPSLALGYTSEVWTRSGTRTVDGRLVSVFDQSYPGSVLDELLVYSHGNDFPQVPLGRLEMPGSTVPDLSGASLGASFVTIWLRLAPSNLPVSTVQAVTSTNESMPAAQYASHVVNIVMPGFGDAQILNGAQAFAFEQAAQAFYQGFADSYHTLSFIPRRSPFAPYAAFNMNVKNDVTGIGESLIDEQASYGSRTLRSVQLYTAGFAGQHETTVHQIAHHWGDRSDLAGIAGVAAAGRQPASHTPLLLGGATLIGAVLEGTRVVERVPSAVVDGDDRHRIARTAAPVTFHPLQLYRMGLVEAAAVPYVTVFGDQAQFSQDAVRAPPIGTPVTGEQRTVNINQIMAALGPRRGPAFTEWRQAFVVVSDELVSQMEMDYFNFYAQRAAAASGTQSYDGYGSFAEATGRRVALRTDIDTRADAGYLKITQPLVVSDVPFGPRDWRGLVFTEPVPSRVVAETSYTLSGTIDTDILLDSFQFIVLRATRHGDAPADAITVQATVSGGRFSVPIRFAVDQRGAYEIDLFVFVDEASPAIPTSAVSPLFVE